MKKNSFHSDFNQFTEWLTGYRITKLLMLAAKKNIADIIGSNGCTIEHLIKKCQWDMKHGKRFLSALAELGILEIIDNFLLLRPFAKNFLLTSSNDSQINTLQFEEKLISNWNTLENVIEKASKEAVQDKSKQDYKNDLRLFIAAMDEAANIRSKELWDIIDIPKANGLVLDVASGSGAYLRSFLRIKPNWSGLFLDLPEVIEIFKENYLETDLLPRINFIAGNLLENKSLTANLEISQADILLMSNLIHCQSKTETETIIKNALAALKDDGFVIVHDFFQDMTEQGCLYDLHMMVNTFNGRTYSIQDIADIFKNLGLPHWIPYNLPSKSSALFLARKKEHLPNLGREFLIVAYARQFHFNNIKVINPLIVPVRSWVPGKCQTGCDSYGKNAGCPPHSHSPEKMQEILKEYHKAIVLVGTPPLINYHENLLELEKQAFLQGFYKAQAFSAGPCPVCEECQQNDCIFPEKRRFSLEACGCDVFSLARELNIDLKPLQNSNDYVRYISMLLLE